MLDPWASTFGVKTADPPEGQQGKEGLFQPNLLRSEGPDEPRRIE